VVLRGSRVGATSRAAVDDGVPGPASAVVELAAGQQPGVQPLQPLCVGLGARLRGGLDTPGSWLRRLGCSGQPLSWLT